MRLRVPLLVIALVAIASACTSTSTNEGSGGASGDGGGTGGSGGSAACTEDAGADCFDCCQAAHPSGFDQWVALLTPGVCEVNVCDVDCKPDVCVDSGSVTLSLPCKLCVGWQAEGIAQGCTQSAACKAWLDCFQACRQ